MRDIYVITHAQSVHHVEKKVGGWYDTGLTEQGRKDASITALRLASIIGNRDVQIFSSDLLRARETAEAIAERFESPVLKMAGLREISYGIAEGKPQAWLDERYIPAPDNDRLDHRPGIDGAETRRELASRIYACMDEVLSQACATQIIVTHGFSLSLIVAAWMKVPIEASGFMGFATKPASITHLQEDERFRSRTVVKLSDTAHLGAPT